MNMSEHIRLSLLEEELRPTMSMIDDDDDRFDFVRTKGPNPKLWIDMTSYVTMGKDQRTYRFQKDSNLGLIVLAETSDLKKTASIISEYVAEQISEREKMMREGWKDPKHLDDESVVEDVETTKDLSQNTPPIDEETLDRELEAELEPAAEEYEQIEAQPKKKSILAGLIWFVIGLWVFFLIIAVALFLGAPNAY